MCRQGRIQVFVSPEAYKIFGAHFRKNTKLLLKIRYESASQSPGRGPYEGPLKLKFIRFTLNTLLHVGLKTIQWRNRS